MRRIYYLIKPDTMVICNLIYHERFGGFCFCSVCVWGGIIYFYKNCKHLFAYEDIVLEGQGG